MSVRREVPIPGPAPLRFEVVLRGASWYFVDQRRVERCRLTVQHDFEMAVVETDNLRIFSKSSPQAQMVCKKRASLADHLSISLVCQIVPTRRGLASPTSSVLFRAHVSCLVGSAELKRKKINSYGGGGTYNDGARA